MRSTFLILLTVLLLLSPAKGAFATESSIEELQFEVTQLVQAGQLAAALPVAEKLVAATQAASGPEHVNTGVVLHMLGAIHANAGNLTAALVPLRRALSILSAALGDSDANTLMVIKSLAVIVTIAPRRRSRQDGRGS